MKQQYIRPISSGHCVMPAQIIALSIIEEHAQNNEGYTLDDDKEEGNALVRGQWQEW